MPYVRIAAFSCAWFRPHLFSGVMVAICGTMSGVFVVAANAWMNSPQPQGYTLDDDTWEPGVNVGDELLAQFNAAQSSRRRSSRGASCHAEHRPVSTCGGTYDDTTGRRC